MTTHMMRLDFQLQIEERDKAVALARPLMIRMLDQAYLQGGGGSVTPDELPIDRINRTLADERGLATMVSLSLLLRGLETAGDAGISLNGITAVDVGDDG